jgi:hypothetical protein
MSGGGFHVHGPNDYRLEHAQQQAADGYRHEADGLPAFVNATAPWTYTLPHPATCCTPS